MTLTPYWISLQLGLWTTVILLPIGLVMGRWLALTDWRFKPWIESVCLMPLVLPPTVIGFYLLLVLSPSSVSGHFLSNLIGQPLVFSFAGLVVASVLVNLPFALQPLQLAYANLPDSVREAAWVSGLSPLQTFWHIELPLIRQGLLASAMLVFTHTLGEFGVVLLVGGNIEGSTRTISIAIYDAVQSFDMRSAGIHSLFLLIASLLALVLIRSQTRSHSNRLQRFHSTDQPDTEAAKRQ